jgi:hypothetical protein
LHDFDVGVLYVEHDNIVEALATIDFHLCGRYDGDVGPSEDAVIRCDQEGNYLIIQIPGEEEILTLCEVMVYGQSK